MQPNEELRRRCVELAAKDQVSPEAVLRAARMYELYILSGATPGREPLPAQS